MTSSTNYEINGFNFVSIGVVCVWVKSHFTEVDLIELCSVRLDCVVLDFVFLACYSDDGWFGDNVVLFSK